MLLKITKISMTFLIIAGVIISILGIKIFLYSKKEETYTAQARVLGSDQAPIKIMEFIDFECPSCAYGAKQLKEVIKQYPGKIRLEVKHYPLKKHRHAYLGSRYAECAAQQKKFWLYHDVLIERQSQWHRLNNAQPAFEQMAKDVHLDLTMLAGCLENEHIDKVIQKNIAEGRNLGVKSTPSYFINGKMVVGFRSLQDELAKVLKGYSDN